MIQMFFVFALIGLSLSAERKRIDTFAADLPEEVKFEGLIGKNPTFEQDLQYVAHLEVGNERKRPPYRKGRPLIGKIIIVAAIAAVIFFFYKAFNQSKVDTKPHQTPKPQEPTIIGEKEGAAQSRRRDLV